MEFIKQHRALLTSILFIIIASIVAVFTRLESHAPNFAAMGALFILTGVIIAHHPKLFLLVPVAFIPLMISDSFIGGYGFTSMLMVYLGYGAMIAMSFAGTRLFNHLGSFLSMPIGSIGFFFFSNLQVWLFWNMYPKTIEGFFQCYLMAIPFFKNSIMSDMLYGSILIGSFIAVQSLFQLKTPISIKTQSA